MIWITTYYKDYRDGIHTLRDHDDHASVPLSSMEDAAKAGVSLLRRLPWRKMMATRISPSVEVNIMSKVLMQAWNRGYRLNKHNIYDELNDSENDTPSDRHRKRCLGHELGLYALSVLRTYPVARSLVGEKYSVIRRAGITGGVDRSREWAPIYQAVAILFKYPDEYDMVPYL